MNREKNSKIMDVSIPITILSPNDLNTPILKTQIVRLYLKSKTQLYAAYKKEKSLLLTKRFKQFKSKRMGKIYHVNTNQKKVGVAILISEREDFKVMNISR